MNRFWAAIVFVIASSACAGCASHSCGDVATSCGQTFIMLQTPNDAWTAGTHTLTLTLGGVPGQCTLTVPASLPSSGVTASCASGASYALALEPLESCPPVVCEGGACGGHGNSCTPVAGHFEMILTIQGLPSQVALDLSVEGTSVLSETIAPQSTATQPNGEGCGTCVNASAKVLVAAG